MNHFFTSIPMHYLWLPKLILFMKKRNVRKQKFRLSIIMSNCATTVLFKRKTRECSFLLIQQGEKDYIDLGGKNHKRKKEKTTSTANSEYINQSDDMATQVSQMKLHDLGLIRHIYTNNFQSFYLSKKKYTMLTKIKISTKILGIPVVVCTQGKGFVQLVTMVSQPTFATLRGQCFQDMCTFSCQPKET